MPMMLTTLSMDPSSRVPNAPRVHSPHPAHDGARCGGRPPPSGMEGDCHRPAVCISTIEAPAAAQRWTMTRMDTVLSRPRGRPALSRSWRRDGRIRELGAAIGGKKELLRRWQEELEKQHRQERVAMGRAGGEAARSIEEEGGASHGRIRGTGRGGREEGRVAMRRSLPIRGGGAVDPVARF